MGEYAIRKSDGEHIKIGTCETMYYIRYEDRSKVEALPCSVDLKDAHKYGLRFRLPVFSEDGIEPGNYEESEGSIPLFHEKTKKNFPIKGGKPGLIYVTHKDSGVQVTFPCYHGEKLPESYGKGDDEVSFRSFHSHAISELVYLKAARMFNSDVILPVVRCKACGEEWRAKWEDILMYIEPAYRKRFAQYAFVVGDNDIDKSVEA